MNLKQKRECKSCQKIKNELNNPTFFANDEFNILDDC